MIIKKAEYITGAVKKSQYPNLNYPEFVFMGRSNVGKSSFINALVGRKKLAYTSSQPGKTQVLNFFNINDEILFVDVPGYGYAKKVVDERLKFGEMIEEYLTSPNLKLCFLLVDIRNKPTQDDILMYEYLKHFNIKVVVIATKSDKVGTTLVLRHLKQVKETLKLSKDDICVAVSSETKKGIEEVWNIILNNMN